LKDFNKIKNNLNNFVNKYYTNQLIKGVLLFLSLGTLFFILSLSIEYFLWLNSFGRFILLSVILLAEFFLLIKFILIPLFYLFKFKKGIDNKQASILIGNHFPQVSDKLFNLLDLSSNNVQGELLLASIEQRSKDLSPIDFSSAVNFKESITKAKYLIIPFLIILLLIFSGLFSSYFGSYDRVINYNLAFEQPAPFSFHLFSNDLNVIKNQDYTITVGIEGKVKPEHVFIVIDDQQYLMNNNNNVFEYTLNKVTNNVNFSFVGNDYSSNSFFLNVIETPSISKYSMVIDYPSYTNQKPDTIYGSGNATLLEGSNVSWLLNTNNTDSVELYYKDSTYPFEKNFSNFKLSKKLYSDFEYQLTTSNSNINNFETLNYLIKIIKDTYPIIEVEEAIDSLTANQVYYSGILSDDYGITRLNLVYYDITTPDSIKSLSLLKPNNTVANFYYTFPSGLDLEQGKQYSYYFEVIDNDAIHSGKRTKSKIFNNLLLTDNQIYNKDLDDQENILSNLDKSIKNLKKQSSSLKKLTDQQKEKSSLSFNDKNKVSSFLNKQEFQESQLQKFSKQLKENLNKNNTNDNLNKLLQERLDRQEKEAEKNRKLLEDIKNLASKIDKNELSKQLENLAKSQKNSERNLEQILELTKRYYVTEALSQLSKDLSGLAEKQKEISNEKILDQLSEKQQDSVNNSFDLLSKKLDDILEDNNSLNKPIKLDKNTNQSKSIQTDQNFAIQSLRNDVKQKLNDSSPKKSNESINKQNSAADKMKKMAENIEQSSSESGSSSVAEDATVLRQILDNLIIFTFKQEDLIKLLDNTDSTFDNQSLTILKEQELKILFSHIDDSLFALSLRVPEISESINSQVSDIYYNIDKSIDNFTESQLYQGVSYQKYVLNSGNILSDLLADILDNMEQSMKPGKGSGDGEDFQLPDIIKGQGELSKKIKKSGQGKPNTNGSSGKAGEKGQEGESGKNGDNKNSSHSNSNNGNADSNDSNEKKGGGPSSKVNSGLSETELKEIYEIYKQQETLKNNLEQQLDNIINNSDRNLAQKLLKQMEEFQDNLLENGITRSTIDKATIIEYELLKLEGAALKQGEKEEMESSYNEKSFKTPLLSIPSMFNKRVNETEILNRQALPLEPNYQNKIKIYFKKND
jgi:hypothetical protein